MSTATSTVMTANYAGFGHRLLALIIDIIVICVVQGFVITPILAVVGIGVASNAQNFENMSETEAMGMIGTLMATMGTIIMVSYVIRILYFSFMESSKFQGSLGKMALGIKVTDMEGNRLSFGKALLRSIGKIISEMIILIGYLLAAFTEKKQALHDMIASTLVVKK